MTERIDSLDTLKGIALLSVFFIHARGSFVDNWSTESLLGFILINTARFGVPVFFLISGYLFQVKLEEYSWSYVKTYLKSVGKYYVLGSLLWLAIQSIVIYLNRFLSIELLSGAIGMQLLSIESLLYLGDAVSPHLWFLTALFISIALIYIFERSDHFKTLLIASILLHIGGILSNAYQLPIGLEVPRTDALFFGLFLTSVGFYIGKKSIELNNRQELLKYTSITLVVLHLVERTAISVLLNSSAPFQWSDYSFMTAPMSIAIFMYALSRPQLGEESRFSEYGKKTLWGYILHPAVLGLFIGSTALIESWTGMNLLQNIVWSILITCGAYMLTMEGLSRNWRGR